MGTPALRNCHKHNIFPSNLRNRYSLRKIKTCVSRPSFRAFSITRHSNPLSLILLVNVKKEPSSENHHNNQIIKMRISNIYE